MIRRAVLGFLLAVACLFSAVFFVHAEETLPGDPFASETEQVDENEKDGDALGGDPFGDAFDLGEGDPFQDMLAKEAPSRVQVSGYLESRNRIRRNGEAISTRQRLWLETDISATQEEAGERSPLRFFASAALDVDPAAASLSSDHDTVRFNGEEAFATIDTKYLDFVAGRKLLRWGTGDGINPLDLINPVDFRDPVASGRADSRVPVLLGQMQARLPTLGLLQEAGLELVFIPLARVNRLNGEGSAWEAAGLRDLREAGDAGRLILDDQERPDDPFEDAEFGARLSGTISGWDVAFIGFHGHNDDPVFARSFEEQADGSRIPRFTPQHTTFNAFGLNVAKGLDRSTIRGELAYKPDLPVTLEDDSAVPGFVRRPVVEGVLGVDRTFGANLYTNLQYFVTTVGGAIRGLAGRTTTHGLTYEIHDKFFQDDLEAGLRGIASFSEQGFTAEVYGEYSLADDWLLAASLLFFEGPRLGSFGQFSENDSLTIRLRYSF
jgi:hypothetical protein